MTAPANTTAAPRTAWRTAWVGWVLIGIVVLYVGVLVLFPVGALVVGAIRAGGTALFATLGDPEAQAAFSLTLRVAAIVTVVNGVLGFITAWVLARTNFPGRRIVNAIIDLPFVLSPVVSGYIFIALFGRLGPLAKLETALNISVVFAVPGVILATIFVTLPLMIRELGPIIATLEREQENTAATLGAYGWQTFWRVIFPAIRWGVLYGLTLTFARALGEFGAVLVVGNNIQGITETAPLYIYSALNNNNSGGAYWMAVGLAVISLALVLGVGRLRRLE